MTNLDVVVDAAKEVLKVLGEGFDEGVYEEALAHELRLRQIPYDRQRNFEVIYKGYRVGEGRIDFIINPLWTNQGGKELVVELKRLAKIGPDQKRQAQVYMLSLNIDDGAVMNFASEVEVVEVTKPSKARDLAVAAPKCVEGVVLHDLLEAGAKEVYNYLGQEFIYCDNAKKIFAAALGVELRLCGSESTGLDRDVLYKGQCVDGHTFEFCFPDGSVADTAFYDNDKKLQELCADLRRYKKAAGIKTARLVAFPKKDKDQVRVVDV